jgi:hypothetical protein
LGAGSGVDLFIRLEGGVRGCDGGVDVAGIVVGGGGPGFAGAGVWGC